MAVNLSPVGGVAAQFFDNNGNPLTGGKIYTYTAGTTTPAATYTSSLGVTAHTNPIVLDAGGRVPGGEIWLTDGIIYKFVLQTSTNVLIATYDNIVGINSNFVNFTAEQEIQTATAGQTVFNLTTMQYQPGTNSLTVYVDGVNQYGPGAQYAYVETDSDTVTFVSGLHVGASVKFTTATQTTGNATNASVVAYDPPFIGSAPTNVEDKLAQTVSLADFGGNVQTALASAIANNSVIQIYAPLTVRVPTDAPTLQDAFDHLIPVTLQPGQLINVLIEAGHQLTTGLYLEYGDYSHFSISSTDATVTLAPGFVVPSPGDVFYFEECHAPSFLILVDCGGVGGRAVSYIGSQGFIGSGKGATNAETDGLYLNGGSTVTATGSTWTNCGRHGAWVTRVSLLNAENSIFSDNTSFGITVRRASRANIQGSEVNDNGSSGVVAARSYINFQGRPGADLDAEAKRNGLHGIVAERGSTVVATSVDASDNVQDNFVALTGSILEATDSIATGAGRNALTADNGCVDLSRANLSGAANNSISASGGACAVDATSCDLKNAGATCVNVTRGARVNVRLADGSNAGANGININTGGYVSGESAVFNDCGSSGIFCDNATASVKGAQFRRASVNGVRAISGSVSAQNVDARKIDGTDSTTDFVITSGGIIHAHGGVGGNSTTPNTLTSAGILFRT